jgi:transcriptional regulator EpsA
VKSLPRRDTRAIELLRTASDAPPELAREAMGTAADAQSLNDVEVETLLLNLEASLRVHQRAHFFSWTQGLLQGVIPHQVLICVSHCGDSLLLRADSFSMIAQRQALYGEMFKRDASFARTLVKAWEDRGFRPLICDADDPPFAAGPLALELARARATQILVHGTHDAQGQTTGLYAFAGVRETLGPRHAHMAQLLTPFVHGAWVRAEVNESVQGNHGADAVETKRITAREQEILRWVSLGKGNFEIGAILNISPLTVKNTVQRILRKLDVVNRAQAVGKAMGLRILQP